MGRSNSFAQIEKEVKELKKDQLLEYVGIACEKITDQGNYFAKKLGKNDEKVMNIIASSILLGMRIAVMDDGVLGQEEERFVKRFMEEILKSSYDDVVKKDISRPLDEKDYNALNLVLSLLPDIEPDWGVNYLRFILGLAYCDGKFEEKVAEKLDGIFGLSILKAFIHQGPIIEDEDETENSKEEIEDNKYIINELKKNLKIENKIWEKEVKEIDAELEQKKEEITKKHETIKAERIAKLQDDNNRIIKYNSDEIEKLTEFNEEHEKEIAGLGAFSFLKKSKLNNQIIMNNQNIEKSKQIIANLKKEYENEYNKIIQEYNNYEINETTTIEKVFRYPERPEKVIDEVSSMYEDNNESFSKKDLYNESYKDEILYLLEALKTLTISELLDASEKLQNLSNQKISSLLNELIDDRLVEKTINDNKVCFRLYDKNAPENNILIDNDLNNAFSKNRKEMFKLLKKNKTFSVEKKGEYKFTKELSNLRLFQILLSLENDKWIDHSITDDEIVFRIK